MKKKKMIIIIGVIGLVVVFIGGISLSKIFSKEPNPSENKNEKIVSYKCQKVVEETEASYNYSVISIEVQNDKIVNITESTMITCKNEALFNELSSSAAFMENKTADQKSLSFTYENEKYNENFLTDNYEDYKVMLENDEYVCE